MKDIIIDPETNHQSFYFFSKLPISNGNEIIFIPLKSIIKLEANSYCTKIYLSDSLQTFTTTKNLGYYEKVLPEYAFCRVQHKYIVNLNSINKIIRNKHWSIMLSDQSVVTLSDNKHMLLLKTLGLCPSY